MSSSYNWRGRPPREQTKGKRKDPAELLERVSCKCVLGACWRSLRDPVLQACASFDRFQNLRFPTGKLTYARISLYSQFWAHHSISVLFCVSAIQFRGAQSRRISISRLLATQDHVWFGGFGFQLGRFWVSISFRVAAAAARIWVEDRAPPTTLFLSRISFWVSCRFQFLIISFVFLLFAETY